MHSCKHSGVRNGQRRVLKRLKQGLLGKRNELGGLQNVVAVERDNCD
jgi:hypothetical protein